jgi:hypothetical protein
LRHNRNIVGACHKVALGKGDAEAGAGQGRRHEAAGEEGGVTRLLPSVYGMPSSPFQTVRVPTVAAAPPQNTV